jgi:SAM-dependent methyltransferase
VSELLAVRALLPLDGQGLEVGVGTGRFAGPLGIKFGIDPAGETLVYAHARGVKVARAVAEALPFARAAFDYAVVVTTICFVDDARAMLREIARVVKPAGTIVIGLIDRESNLGQEYVTHQARMFSTAGRLFTLLRRSRLCSGKPDSATWNGFKRYPAHLPACMTSSRQRWAPAAALF